MHALIILFRGLMLTPVHREDTEWYLRLFTYKRKNTYVNQTAGLKSFGSKVDTWLTLDKYALSCIFMN